MTAPSLTLMYHRINTLKPDPWTTCVSPEHFAEHLQVIRSFPASVSITFDDGYADNFEFAKPLLERYETPAIVFVTSGVVNSQYEMWWDELERKFLPGTRADWDWDDVDADTGVAQYREAFHAAQTGHTEVFPIRPAARPDRRMMTGEEVSRLSAGGLVEIGAHTVTHPVLSRLPPATQRREIVQSKIDLEEHTGARIRFFAYPNGGPADYTDETVRLVREAGFTRAYAAWEAPGDDLFQLSRVMIRDWDGDRFESVLRSKISP